MEVLDVIQQDYQRFPKDQTFDIYTSTVFFKDPLNQFRGIKKYQKMIRFLDRWFKKIKLNLHQIHRNGNTIRTDWTLHMTCPLPWHPRLKISGYSLLELNEQEQIISHIDYWYEPPLKVFLQLFL